MVREGLVSTIVPVYNRAGMLREAVASVLAQSYRPIEVIVVDDGSTDDTSAATADLAAKHPEVRVIHRANGGPGAARETGRIEATGEFIQYLDSDDLLLPEKFALQVAALRARPDADVAYGRTRYRHSDGTIEPGAWKGSGDVVDTMFPSFLVLRWWDTPNPLYRRSLCDRIGPWLTTSVEEDWDYDCRASAFGARLAYVAEFVCEVRDHDADRLSRGGNVISKRLKDRALVHARILGHARRAGIERDAPEMQHFARALFLLARQCGAAGVRKEAEMLFNLAREASESERASGWDFVLIRVLRRLLGWTAAGRGAAALDRMKSRLKGRRQT